MMLDRRNLLPVVLLVAALGGIGFFRSAGSWLLVEDSLEPAGAVVVLGGQVPFRAMEAAAVYHQGLVSQVWVTQGATGDEDSALAELRIERPPEDSYSVMVLLRSGVPDSAIRVLPRRTDSTASEVCVISAAAKSADTPRVILITSKYHTRRVRVLWKSLVGDHPQAIVRFAARDPFEPEHWWRTSSDAMAVSREWFGLLNAWAGFPVSSSR